MEKFFARWRAFSERIVRVMVVVCGAMCLAGMLEVRRLQGPVWLMVAFGIAGALLIAFSAPRKKS